MAGHSFEKTIEFIGAKHGSGWIVGIREIHDSRLGRDRLGYCIQIESIVPNWDLDELSAGSSRDD